MNNTSIIDIVNAVGHDYTFSITQNTNMATLTVTEVKTGRFRDSVLPLDHHLNMDRVVNLIQWSKQEISKQEVGVQLG